ncbi:Uncharacterised protein [Cedecea lapagei]|uniref:Uncharacterized protein n=1 Tax=Cedecea lapagei TaxID=158823 RepID=A0A447V5Q9_9ENTR|nr:Uncharacterised protein [Cedecea lapagei]
MKQQAMRQKAIIGTSQQTGETLYFPLSLLRAGI